MRGAYRRRRGAVADFPRYAGIRTGIERIPWMKLE
jgi:hypothetical protein